MNGYACAAIVAVQVPYQNVHRMTHLINILKLKYAPYATGQDVSRSVEQ